MVFNIVVVFAPHPLIGFGGVNSRTLNVPLLCEISLILKVVKKQKMYLELKKLVVNVVLVELNPFMTF